MPTPLMSVPLCGSCGMISHLTRPVAGGGYYPQNSTWQNAECFSEGGVPTSRKRMGQCLRTYQSWINYARLAIRRKLTTEQRTATESMMQFLKDMYEKMTAIVKKPRQTPKRR